MQHIVELWRGCIESRYSALQLFLIVAYICDWARDIYRPAILNELKIFSSHGTYDPETNYTDSDIFSSREVNSASSFDERTAHSPESQSIEKATFHALDSPYGAVRHASFTESEFYAIIITSDNVNTLLQSTHEKVVASFSRQILGQLQRRSILLGPEHVATIENQWTGATST